MTFELDPYAGSLHVVHLEGVPWYSAPIPSRWHKCTIQTSAFVKDRVVDRCACGAIRIGLSLHWMEKNSRLKHEKRKRRENKGRAKTRQG